MQIKNLFKNSKYEKYLPSKKFTYLILTFIGTGILIFLISILFFGKTSFLREKKESKLAAQKLTINDLLKRDSDGDGIMDWEEGLWGTDPYNTKTFENTPDIEYIKSKKEALKNPTGSGLSNENLSETDKFAQQFFASLAAIKQSGQFNDSDIKSMATALGEAIANPTILNTYDNNSIKINIKDTPETQKIYYSTIGDLFISYQEKGIGNELGLISPILTSSKLDTKIEEKIIEIANYYQEYATKLLSIPTPKSLISYHLRIINSSNNTGIAIKNMIKAATDPVVGLTGIAQYQQYSDELINAVQEMETILSINDII